MNDIDYLGIYLLGVAISLAVIYEARKVYCKAGEKVNIATLMVAVLVVASTSWVFIAWFLATGSKNE